MQSSHNAYRNTVVRNTVAGNTVARNTVVGNTVVRNTVVGIKVVRIKVVRNTVVGIKVVRITVAETCATTPGYIATDHMRNLTRDITKKRVCTMVIYNLSISQSQAPAGGCSPGLWILHTTANQTPCYARRRL
jgi:hypothetical protein